MPTRNVLYDPNAVAKHRRHAAERDRLGVVLRGWNSSRAGRRLRSRMQAAYDAHHQASLETFKTRHATVQEYARWRFRDWAGNGEAPVVDFEVLKSVEEVDQLYQRLQAEVRMFRMSSLPVGQPPGMTAFCGGDVQFWRHFKQEELLTGSYHASKGARALVTISGRDGLWHVCFMQDWTYVGVEVSEVFQDLANSFYRQALVQAAVRADLRRAMRGRVRGWLGRLVPRQLRGAALRPGSFRFYEHRPPRWLAGEEFGQVRLRFRHGRFGSPAWEAYDVVPASLASARHAASPDAETGFPDVIPALPQAGIQGGKGVARRFGRLLTEPALIVGAGVAGALIEFSYGHMPGDNLVIGTAATAASVAITVGAIRLLMKKRSRGG